MILLTSGFIQLNSVSIVYIKFIEGNNLKKKKIFKSYLTLVSKFKRSWIFFKDFCGLLRLYAVFIHRKYPKGPFKYYVIKEVGGWGQKMAILDEIGHSAQIQPKSQFLFHKNLPPRDFSIMTLNTAAQSVANSRKEYVLIKMKCMQ